MKLGVNTLIWSDGFDASHVKLFEPIKKAGFDGMEFPLFSPDPQPDVKIRRALEETGLQCTFCSILPPGFNTISDDPAIRARSKQYWTDTVRTVAEMGGKILCGSLYSPVGHFAGLGALSSAASIWRDLAPTSGAIAFDGVKFLKAQMKRNRQARP